MDPDLAKSTAFRDVGQRSEVGGARQMVDNQEDSEHYTHEPVGRKLLT